MSIVSFLGLFSLVYLCWIIYKDRFEKININKLFLDFKITGKTELLIRNECYENISRYNFRKTLKKILLKNNAS